MKNKFNHWTNEEFKDYQNKILEQEKKSNAIIRLIEFEKYNYPIKSNLLENVPFAIKDNYATKGQITSGATALLDDFVPNYSSTVFKKLLGVGAIPLFKTNLDELAMGGTGLWSHYGKVPNPFSDEHIIGGSSSGSAYLVAKDIIPFSIGSDTGDSVRRPAVFGAIVGFKPTWGLVSRYGLFDFAPTWDTVAWFTRNVDYAALLLEILQGFDSNDASSLHSTDQDFLKDINTDKKFKIGIIKPFLDEVNNKEIFDNYFDIIEKLEKDGHKIHYLDVDITIFKKLLIVYRIISSIEGLSCNSNLTGFLFGSNFGTKGSYIDKITESRSNFKYGVKQRFLFAVYGVLNDETIYHQARKVRTIIIEEFKKMFLEVDAIVMPAHNSFTPKISDYSKKEPERYGSIMDDYLGFFNANGSPSITVPITQKKEKSTAVNIAAKPFDDKVCLQVAKIIEGYGAK